MKNSILIDSAFGHYLSGLKPDSIANEFLYYNPTILLWADELICDSNALIGELDWAGKGFLASELSIRLSKKRIITSKDYSIKMDRKTINLLKEESKQDVTDSYDCELSQFLFPDFGSNTNRTDKSFFDINTLLYLSAKERLPFLPTSPTIDHFNWKYKKWFDQLNLQKAVNNECELICFKHIFNIHVPSLELFPHNSFFYEAEESTKNMLKASYEHEKKRCSEKYVEEQYNKFLNSWLKYDKSVREEVYDNFDLICDLRNDKRLVSLRQFIKEYSVEMQENKEAFTPKEIDLKLQKKLLEIEYEIADNNTHSKLLDNYCSQITFPIQALVTIGGLATGFIANNPFFTALGLAPSLMTWLNHNTKNISGEKYLWQSFLRDSNKRIENSKKLFKIEKQLKNI